MIRQMNLADETDGRRYQKDDVARLGCNDCEGCSECCRTVGDTILLDPWDIYMLTTGLGSSMENMMLQNEIALRVVDGLIVPFLQVRQGTGCAFLNAQGRCSIHSFRPMFCRLFPLGRLYEGDTFSYILQVHECRKERCTHVRIRDWLGIENLEEYERYIADWHFMTKKFQEQFSMLSEEEQKRRNMQMLQIFYLQPYRTGEDFYSQYRERRNLLKS